LELNLTIHHPIVEILKSEKINYEIVNKMAKSKQKQPNILVIWGDDIGVTMDGPWINALLLNAFCWMSFFCYFNHFRNYFSKETPLN